MCMYQITTMYTLIILQFDLHYTLIKLNFFKEKKRNRTTSPSRSRSSTEL